MGQGTKTSIILTTYNRSRLLRRAVDSVLRQSDPDIELLIVDDGSTDDTREIGLNYEIKDSRVHFFHLDENHGSDSYPKNFGIKHSTGDFIMFLDDDDEYRVDAVKILRKYIVHSGADAVYGDYLNHDLEGKTSPGWSVDFNAGMLGEMNYISMPTIILRKECLLEVGGFDETIPKFKDWNLWLRLQKRGYRFLHIPIIVTEVHQQKESVSSKFEVKYAEDGHYLPTFFNPADCTILATKSCLLEGERNLRVAVFTMTMDRLDYTKQMYESFKLAGYPFDWFVIDQGSTDGTKEWLQALQAEGKAKVNFLDKNIGIAKGWNMAVRDIKEAGGYGIVIKIDNDCEMMSQDWLKAMVDIFECNRMFILSPYVEGLEDSPGGVLRVRGGAKDPYVLVNDRVLGLVPNLGGICFAAPIELYKDFTFDENGFMAGNKDFMLSQYAKGLGYSLFYVEELRLWHIDGTKGQKEKYPEYFKKNYEAVTSYPED